jgi:hypothetical protein
MKVLEITIKLYRLLMQCRYAMYSKYFQFDPCFACFVTKVWNYNSTYRSVKPYPSTRTGGTIAVNICHHSFPLRTSTAVVGCLLQRTVTIYCNAPL